MRKKMWRKRRRKRKEVDEKAQHALIPTFRSGRRALYYRLVHKRCVCATRVYVAGRCGA